MTFHEYFLITELSFEENPYPVLQDVKGTIQMDKYGNEQLPKYTYRFTTDSDTKYIAAIYPDGGFVFTPLGVDSNDKHLTGGFDIRISATLISILKDFFQKHPDTRIWFKPISSSRKNVFLLILKRSGFQVTRRGLKDEYVISLHS